MMYNILIFNITQHDFEALLMVCFLFNMKESFYSLSIASHQPYLFRFLFISQCDNLLLHRNLIRARMGWWQELLIGQAMQCFPKINVIIYEFFPFKLFSQKCLEITKKKIWNGIKITKVIGRGHLIFNSLNVRTQTVKMKEAYR